MVTELFDFEQLKLSENFSIKEYKDSYYIGETDPEKNDRNGFGICVYLSGRYYEGSWSNDKRHGKGYE